MSYKNIQMPLACGATECRNPQNYAISHWRKLNPGFSPSATEIRLENSRLRGSGLGFEPPTQIQPSWRGLPPLSSERCSDGTIAIMQRAAYVARASNLEAILRAPRAGRRPATRS